MGQNLHVKNVEDCNSTELRLWLLCRGAKEQVFVKWLDDIILSKKRKGRDFNLNSYNGAINQQLYWNSIQGTWFKIHLVASLKIKSPLYLITIWRKHEPFQSYLYCYILPT